MNPLVSVIVPVYKVEAYLDRCVSSIVNQTYKNLEIFLVDDGSPDSCPGMCDEWASKDNRIRVIHKENGGLSDARNAALDIATGEYFTFVDSDDMIALNMIEIFIKVAEQEQSDVVMTKQYLSFSKIPPPVMTTLEETKTVLPENALEIMFCDYMRWEAWGSLYHKSVFNNLRFPFGKLYEDIPVIPRAVLLSKQVSFIQTKGYYYFSNPESIMRSGNRNAVIKYDLYTAISQMVDLFQTISSKKARVNATAGILEELLSRVHLASGNKTANQEFIHDSKVLAFKNLRSILLAKKITAKRKVFMLLVLCGLSKVCFK